jgi:hypothetical protein
MSDDPAPADDAPRAIQRLEELAEKGEFERVGQKPRAQLDVDRFETATVNANGQIYLGRDLEGVKVHVAIEIVEDPDEQEQEVDE